MDEPLHTLVHRLWTKAVGTPDYNKAEWMAVEYAVNDIQRAAKTNEETFQLARIADALEAMGGAPWVRR